MLIPNSVVHYWNEVASLSKRMDANSQRVCDEFTLTNQSIKEDGC